MSGRMRAWGGRGLLLLVVAALGTDRGAEGYRLWFNLNGFQEMWRAGSPAQTWDDAAGTFSWSLSTHGFPHPNLPSVAQAGTGVENGWKTIEDVTGARIKFQRRPNSTGRLVVGDGLATVEFHSAAGDHPVMGDITGIYAMVVSVSDDNTGTFTSMDVLFNATDGDVFDWSIATDDPNTFDVETTHVHEALHAIGLGHTSYFYAGVYQFGRDPEVELHDRCYSPDDRNGIRTVYPEAPALAAISGTVTLSGGGAVANAVVIATDANGIPQATAYTDNNGAYTMNVPPGADYDVTAAHVRGISFNEFDFAPTPFISATTATVTAPSAGVNLTATTGTPLMRLAGIDGGFQALFVDKGFTGNVALDVVQTGGATFASADISSLSFGDGITVNGAPAALSVGGATRVTANITVAAGAAAGTRSIALTRTNGERMMVPGAVLVRDTGALVISGTSTAAAVPLGTFNHVMLRFDLAASAVEDVRVRRIAFDVTGTGPAVPAVRLWRDADGDDTFNAGADERIFTSAAYANAIVSETIPYPGGNGQVVFDLIAVSILAGQTETFFVTFDMPAAGTGSYAVSLTPTGLSGLTHGMHYGDVIVPTGSAAGGTMTLGAVGISNLGQFENVGGTPAIPVGGATAQTSVVLRGVVVGSTGNLSMEVELKPITTPFDGTGTMSSTPTASSGQTHEITWTGLTNATSYHWRARGASSAIAQPSAWQSFGNNADGAIDFSVDNSTTTIAGLEQLGADRGPLAIAATTDGVVYLRATVTNSASVDTRLEVEIVAAGAAFANAPTHASALVPSGSVAEVSFTGPLSGDYRWQARAVNRFGRASAWTDFGANGTSLDFHLNAINEINASAGCAGRASADGREAVCLLGGVLLLSLLVRRRRGAAAAMLLVMAVPALAHEAEAPLPSTLSAEPQMPPEASASLSAYLGVEILDLEFDALGTDLRDRNLEGMGMPTLGVEGLINLGEDFRLGLALEAGYWGDTTILSAGPLVAWRFAVGREVKFQPPEMEHYLKLGLMYRQLEVSKSGFGDFEPAFALRGGYELRLNVGEWLMVALAADVRYSVFEFDDDVLQGDDEVGGVGVLISVGLAWLP